MVLCGTCGNNCCNAGYGKGPDGEWGTCPDCPGAYDDQDRFKKDPDSIQFSGDDRETAKVEGKAAMEREGFRRVRDMNREELEQLKVDFPDLFSETSGEVVGLPVPPAGGASS